MRRLPGILLFTGASLVVAAALVVSGLRLLLPHVDSWRPTLLAQIESRYGIPVKASALVASWQNFGPTLDARDLAIGMKDGGTLQVKRITVALDVWQSLLHMRWQFRDLTFYQLHMRSNTPLAQNSDSDGDLPADRIRDLFLQQFDHFDLRDSSLSFLTLSGERAELTIPQLTWLNGRNRHRAEGTVNLSSFNGQHGLVSVRMDLRDVDGVLNKGVIWLKADDVDVKPWLNKWAQEKIAIDSARFSMTAWVNVDKGDIDSGDIWLRKGGASWKGDDQNHHLTVDNLLAHLGKVEQGWQVNIPSTSIKIDDKPWSKGSMALAWFPQQKLDGADGKFSDELRVRATNMQLGSFTPFLPLVENASAELGKIWRTVQPQGQVDQLAADIPLQHPEKTRLQGRWENISWKQWELLPGVEHLSGSVSGSLEDGQLTALVTDAKMPYEGVFRAPLEIKNGKATLGWKNNADGWSLSGKNIDVAATGVRAAGGFRYNQPKDDQPWLSILAGISTPDGGQAWRYFPENLMGKELVDYLSGAIQGGKADNATLVYAGNPHFFPYLHNEGQFQVYVPLRDAKFAFQPDWPALEHLDITLNFVNNGLWMNSNSVMLGGVKASGLTANIPDYDKEKLLIDADIAGPGESVGPYFDKTPLKASLGATLEQLQLTGGVNARLHLDIPLDGELTTAKGDVRLNNNQLLIKPLESTLKNLSGQFSFTNGDLQSQTLHATWFNQPVAVDFNTHEGEKAFDVGVNLQGNWQPVKTGLLPRQLDSEVSGSIPWQGKVAITLPYDGMATYDIGINGDMKQIASDLPAPANKRAGSPLPMQVQVKGDLNHFDLTANLGNTSRFNSRWLLKKKLTLDRAILASDTKTVPPLPDTQGIELNLPALDGVKWLALFREGAADQVSSSTEFPAKVTLRTPLLTLGGQQWKNISVMSQPTLTGTQVTAEGREINAALMMSKNGPWKADIKYLYFNPTLSKSGSDLKTMANGKTPDIDFSRWPSLQLRCAECWIWGQKYGRIDADLAVEGKRILLSHGLMDTGFSRLTADGEWVNAPGEVRTSLKGTLKGKKLDTAADFFGVSTPIQGSSFNVDYDLHWRDVPWSPQLASLSGITKVDLGKGEIAELGTGRAGQLLRLVSFDALIRKLQFDFSDTFGSGFYFDSIRSTAWIKDGVMHTDNTLVDGLEADIAMQGSVDLVNRRLDLEAVVAPEISATVGVATAFVINPVVGAAVFAASKVLGPLWNKISVLRYRISGPMDKPQINEVLRKPRIEKKQ